jgi:hypothetical protein
VTGYEVYILNDVTMSNQMSPPLISSDAPQLASTYWSKRGFVSIMHQQQQEVLELIVTFANRCPELDIHLTTKINVEACADSIHTFGALVHAWLFGSSLSNTNSNNVNSNANNNTNTNTSTTTTTTTINTNTNNTTNNTEPDVNVGDDNESYVVLALMSNSTAPPTSTSPSQPSHLSTSSLSSDAIPLPRVRWLIPPPYHITMYENYSPPPQLSTSISPRVRLSLQDVTFMWNMCEGSDRKLNDENRSSSRGHVLMQVTFENLRLEWIQFKESLTAAVSLPRRPRWNLRVTVRNIFIKDLIPTSSWRTFLCADNSTQNISTDILAFSMRCDELFTPLTQQQITRAVTLKARRFSSLSLYQNSSHTLTNKNKPRTDFEDMCRPLCNPCVS